MVPFWCGEGFDISCCDQCVLWDPFRECRIRMECGFCYFSCPSLHCFSYFGAQDVVQKMIFFLSLISFLSLFTRTCNCYLPFSICVFILFFFLSHIYVYNDLICRLATFWFLEKVLHYILLFDLFGPILKFIWCISTLHIHYKKNAISNTSIGTIAKVVTKCI